MEAIISESPRGTTAEKKKEKAAIEMRPRMKFLEMYIGQNKKPEMSETIMKAFLSVILDPTLNQNGFEINATRGSIATK
jgi:hypothetical protein